MEDVSISIQISDLHGVFPRFGLFPLHDIFIINEKISVATGTTFQRQEVSKNKETQVKTQYKLRSHKN